MSRENERRAPGRTRAKGYTANVYEDSLTPFQAIVTSGVGVALFFAMPWLLWYIA